MNHKTILVITIFICSFFCLLFITQLIDGLLLGDSTGRDFDLSATLVVGSVVIVCTFLIIDKINEKL